MYSCPLLLCLQTNEKPPISRRSVVDDQGLEVAYTSLKPSKERRLSDIIFVQYSKNTQKTAYNLHFAKERNKCLGSKLRNIFYTTSMVLLGKLKNQTKRDLRRS